MSCRLYRILKDSWFELTCCAHMHSSPHTNHRTPSSLSPSRYHHIVTYLVSFLDLFKVHDDNTHLILMIIFHIKLHPSSDSYLPRHYPIPDQLHTHHNTTNIAELQLFIAPNNFLKIDTFSPCFRFSSMRSSKSPSRCAFY